MKKIILLWAIFLASTTCTLAQKNDLDEIRSILDNQVAAWNRGNLKDFMQGYWSNDSLSFVTSKGLLKGYDKLLNHYQQSYPNREKMGNLNFIILKVEKISPEIALVVGNWDVTTNDNHFNGYFSLVFKKINGKWKIILDHSS
ncbi:MAG: nuclear transport factor 2 family protein [Sediminibacterium sp.]|nr:nuclear transport factor 2 family protein [Sediminibacterium sp.]